MAGTSKVRWTVTLVIIPVAAILAAWLLRPIWAWVTVIILLLAFILIAGRQIVQLWRGALVDERNKTSLSRFQTVLWTVLIVSAFLVAAIHNVETKQADPLQITVPAELWVVLGISVTSLVGSGLIKQEKAKTTPEGGIARLALSKASGVETEKIGTMGNGLLMGEKTLPKGSGPGVADDAAPPGTSFTIMAQGVLAANDQPNQSSWLDMFGAEEVGNIGRLDLGKIQMFYFTIILVFSYAAALASLLASSSGKIDAFPALTQSAIALLGISHAAYLANKAVPRTPTT
jgi:hypothetical protein